MLFLYFLMLVLAADAESEQITSALKEIKTVFSAVNLRLARIEDQQKITESMYSRHEDKISCFEGERSNMILWQQYTVSLIKEQKVNDEGLETKQKTMMSRLKQLADNTNRCCRDNMTVTCANVISAPARAVQPPTATTPQPPTTTTTQQPTTTPVLQSCKNAQDGVHQLKVGDELIPVLCDGGFVTFQRRYNGELDFDRTWADYEQGFGSASSEYWMGLRYLHEMTKDKSCTFRARIAVDDTKANRDMCANKYKADCDGQIKEIVATDFRVLSAATKYRINVVFNRTDFVYRSLPLQFKQLSGLRFTTKDRDNDQHPASCARATNVLVNGGFWYQQCMPGYPNSVIFKSATHCSNAVCGLWWPYYFSSSMLQFSC